MDNFWHLLTQVDANQIKLIATNNMGIALFLCFVSGILTSFTPCVYPMIPITINIFGRLAQQDPNRSKRAFNPRTFWLSVVYVAGMCATYSTMGLLAGLSGSLFGKILQSSFFLGFLTVLFFVLALGQFGLFKLQLPPSVQTYLSQKGHSRNIFGIFLMGLFSGLIVSPCVGPVIAGVLAFVFDTSNAFRGFLYFLSFSLGLGMLFLLIGGFSGLLSQLPRSGMWMERVNRILAALMLVAAGYYGFLWAKQVGLFKTSHEQVEQVNTWITDEETARAVAKERQVPIIVDFTAEWCEACHVIDKTVFQDPTVSARMKNFVLLRIDVTKDSDENQEKLKKFGVLSLPAVVFVDRAANTLDNPRVHGVITPESFLTTLNAVDATK